MPPLAFDAFDEAVDAFLGTFHERDVARARSVLAAAPRLVTDSVHVAAALGDVEVVTRHLDADPACVSARVGAPAADPLLALCYSPFHGESAERDAGLLATARLLLDAGADPNTRDGLWGVPALYAVTGARSVPVVARLLLDHGANPTDGESVFHAAERFHADALELLLAAGVDLNHIGDWGNTALWFLLRWHDVERNPDVRQGFAWLLDHGADPNVRSGRAQETALHVAAWRGQSPVVVRQLLAHGADVQARRADGSTAWRLARRGGFDAIAALLEASGATAEPLGADDELLAACGRGDVDAARRLTSPTLVASLSDEDRQLLPTAAGDGREATALACIAARFPVDAVDAQGATALHHAAIQGRASLVRALLAAGADLTIRDPQHHSTPLGWATFAADHVAHPEGDYPGCVADFLAAGARLADDEYQPRDEAVRHILARVTG